MNKAAYIRVQGRVQGVGYRFFALAAAEAHGLKGWVRNTPGGDVESEVEGPVSDVESFIEALRKGPPVARVDSVDVDWRAPSGQFTGFEIR